MENNRSYKFRTTEDLIETYAWCEGREGAETARRLIKAELKSRFDKVLRLLDDEQTTENPHGTYIRLIEG